MRLWSLVVVLSLLAVVGIFMLISDDLLSRMGPLTVWSAALFLALITYSLASLAGALAIRRAPKQEVRGFVLWYATAVALALLIAAAYLTCWGIIGLRP